MIDPLSFSRSQEITEAIETNLHAFVELWAELPGTEVQHDREVVRIATGTPTASLNLALASRPMLGHPEARVDATVRFFEARKLPFLWYDLPSSRARVLTETLKEYGFTLAFDSPGMGLDLSETRSGIDMPEGLEIVAVEDDETMKQWVEVSQKGYDIPRKVRSAYANLAMSFYRLEPLRLYLGRLNGKPVATSMLAFGGEAAGIYWVSTVREARKKGIGTAITEHSVLQAGEHGYNLTVLVASEMGRSIYERIGFEEHCRIRAYAKL